MNIAKANSYNIRFGNLAGVLIFLAIAFNAFSTSSVIAASNPILAILNLEDRINYTRRYLGGYADAMQTVSSLPEGAKVIMLWETRSLECMPKCDPDEIIGRWYNDWSVHRDEDRVIHPGRNKAAPIFC